MKVFLNVILLILTNSILSGDAQLRRRQPPASPFRPGARRRNRNQDPPKERIKCLACDAEFTYPGVLSETQSKISDVNAHPMKNTCFNPHLNTTEAEEDFLVTCPSRAEYCTTEVQYINNVVVRIDRRCSEQVVFCKFVRANWVNPVGPFPEHCVTKGFGLAWRYCYTCCPGSGEPPEPLPASGRRPRPRPNEPPPESLRDKYGGIKGGNQGNCYFRN